MSNESTVVNMNLTQAGERLRAKMEMGDGTLPLNITRIVAGSGRTETPYEQTDVAEPQQEFDVSKCFVEDNRTTIKAVLTNMGLEFGYDMWQIGFFAADPDEGEILYRLTQFAEPRRVPPAREAGWTYTPEFNFRIHNASDVTIIINPSGVALKSEVDEANEIARQAREIANAANEFAQDTRATAQEAKEIAQTARDVAGMAQEAAANAVSEVDGLQDRFSSSVNDLVEDLSKLTFELAMNGLIGTGDMSNIVVDRIRGPEDVKIIHGLFEVDRVVI